VNEKLLSVGVGVELQLWRNIDLRLDYGIPLIGEEDFLVHPVHSGDGRFHFLLSLLW
jgi:hypothetical protein